MSTSTPSTTSPIHVNKKNIQGDILSGLPKKTQTFMFFKITDGKRFVSDLVKFVPLVKTVEQSLEDRKAIEKHKREGRPGLIKLVGVNISLTTTGLRVMGISDAEMAPTSLSEATFQRGAVDDAQNLGDPQFPLDDPTNPGKPKWEGEFLNQIDGLILVAGDCHQTVDEKIQEIHQVFPANPNHSSIAIVKTIVGDVRPGPEEGHEHFGFLDGVSNPLIAGFDDFVPGPAPIDAKNILTGYNNTINPNDWTKDGSFLVFRYLFQLVPEFNTFLQTNAIKKHPITSEPLSTEEGSELLGARLVGRWKSGAPVDLSPFEDNLKLANNIKQRNDFQFTDEFVDNNRCPWAAHIRRTNPRADVTRIRPLDNRRIMRRGIAFGPELTAEEQTSAATKEGRGLLFACYQANISDGFQFIQQSWANNKNFPFGTQREDDAPFEPGIDPIIGQADPREMTGYDPLSANNPKQQPLLMDTFVVPHGGAYLFVPSIKLLREFSSHVTSS